MELFAVLLFDKEGMIDGVLFGSPTELAQIKGRKSAPYTLAYFVSHLLAFK